MTPGEYAAYERSMGATVLESDGIYWRRVRPGFYRPLLVFEPLNHLVVRPPYGAVWGGWQYVVCDWESANSRIHCLMYRRVHDYEVDSRAKRRQIRSAERVFTVRRLNSPEELARAHGAYVDFQHRTGYKYRADRLDPARFMKWARDVFSNPRVLVLGACRDDLVHAVGIALLVEHTLVYSTFFASSDALKQNAASLVLHALRTVAAACSHVQQIFVGFRKTGKDAAKDEFYLQRGCEVVTLPARLHVHPVTGWLLRTFRPDLWRRLLGQPVEDPKPVAPAVAIKSDPEEVP